MIAHLPEHPQPILLIDPTIQAGQATIRVLVEVARPNVHPTQGIVKQSHRINAILPKGTFPCNLRLKALINTSLGVDYLMVSFWEQGAED